MSMLKNLESKIAGLVEGTFSRAFRSEVRPVEVARKLTREMDDHRAVSLSRTYVPNEYFVYLSPRDRERFGTYEDALRTELAGHLLEHARREHFSLLSRPVIQFRTDERLGLGEFGIQTRVVHPEEDQGSVRQGDSGKTMVYSTSERLSQPLEERAQQRQHSALLTYEGKRLVVGSHGAVLGRSRECDVTVDDANVSRRHAEIRPRGGAWVLTDLGSTNGVSVNGARVDQPRVLSPGDVIEVGTTQITFALE